MLLHILNYLLVLSLGLHRAKALQLLLGVP